MKDVTYDHNNKKFGVGMLLHRELMQAAKFAPLRKAIDEVVSNSLFIDKTGAKKDKWPELAKYRIQCPKDRPVPALHGEFISDSLTRGDSLNPRASCKNKDMCVQMDSATCCVQEAPSRSDVAVSEGACEWLGSTMSKKHVAFIDEAADFLGRGGNYKYEKGSLLPGKSEESNPELSELWEPFAKMEKNLTVCQANRCQE
jgi:hypothetical protein